MNNCKYCNAEYHRGQGVSAYCSEKCRFWAKVIISGPDDCWDWTGALVKDGYGQFARTSTNKSKKHITSSRMAWTLTYGEIPDALKCLHTCDRPVCCNPGHLFLGTDLDNSRDMEAKGRSNHPRGQGLGPITKLTPELVSELKRLRREGMTTPVLADVFGITDGHVSNIMAGRVWNYIP